jgi:hypothetical protein
MRFYWQISVLLLFNLSEINLPLLTEKFVVISTNKVTHVISTNKVTHVISTNKVRRNPVAQ